MLPIMDKYSGEFFKIENCTLNYCENFDSVSLSEKLEENMDASLQNTQKLPTTKKSSVRMLDKYNEQDPPEKKTIFSKEDLNNIIRKEIKLFIENLHLSNLFVKRSEIFGLQHLCHRNTVGLIGRSISEVAPNFYLSDSINDDIFSSAFTYQSQENKQNDYDFLRSIDQPTCDDENSSISTLENTKDSVIWVDNEHYEKNESLKVFHPSHNVLGKCDKNDNNLICEETESISSTCLNNLNSRIYKVKLQIISLHNLIKRLSMKRRNKKKRVFINLKNNLNKYKIDKVHNSNKKIECGIETIDEVVEETKEIEKKDTNNKNVIYKTRSKLGKEYYDEFYYEWREYEMNLFHYKKSHTSLSLNNIPKLPDFVKPPSFCKNCLSTNPSKWPIFRLTPSREKLLCKN